MSTPEATPAATVDVTKTGADAGAAAAERGATPDEVREIVASAMAARNTQTAAQLDKAQLDAIADRVVQQFEERGAFAPPETPPTEVDPSTPPAAPVQTVDGPQRQPDQQPKKFSAAERFMGRHKS